MSDTNLTPPTNIVPFPLTGKSVVPAKREIPPELAKLDNQPIASVQPDANAIPATPIVRGNETANSTEFNLHADGTLMKYSPWVNHEPMQLLVDGYGRQFGLARNAEVADMICNGVNAMHLAIVMKASEEQSARAEANPGGAPPALLLPPKGDL